jgi:hypothetical protein
MRKAGNYILRDRDETLDEFEYYVEDINGKIQKGWICELYFNCHANREMCILRNNRGKIKSWRDDYGGFAKSDLYDNKDDCRENAHAFFDGWEEALENN